MERTAPVYVNMTGVLLGTSISHISAGFNHALVSSYNQLYCWGDNTGGKKLRL